MALNLSSSINISPPPGSSFSANLGGDVLITGSLHVSQSIYDTDDSTGTLGQVLSSTVSGSQWVDAAGSSGITGAGTTGTITKWTTGGSVIGDSIIAEDASTITVDGGANGRVRVKVNEAINSFGKFDFSTSDTATSSATMIAEITATVTNTDDTTPLTSELSFATNSGDSLNPALTISSGGNVGIGTGNPNRNLSVVSATSTSVEIKSGITNQSSLFFSDTDDEDIGGVLYTHNDNTMAFRVNNFNRFTILPGGDMFSMYNNMSSANNSYRQAFWGGLSIQYRNAVDSYINSNHTYDSTNQNIATFNATQGIGRLELTGGTLQWSTYSGTVGFGSAYVMTPKFRIESAGTVFINNLGSSASSNADMRYDTSSKELYYLLSSLRYKKDVVNLEDSLSKITSLRAVRYKDKNTNKNACGLIAEETVQIIPEVVFTKEIEGFDDPQVEGINYSDIVPFLIKGMQEQQTIIEDLKSRIETLEG
jgi:hypothetical protein